MKIEEFKLERYFAEYEFNVRYILCASDCEPLSLEELLSMADDQCGQLWQNLKLGYTESAGHPLLREEIAELYKSIAPQNVLVLAPEEGIFIAMNALLERGDHVIVTFPTYQSLYEVAGSLGCDVTRWIPEESNGWRFDVKTLKKNIRENTRLIVINFPHNPTGAMISHSEFEEIIKIAEDHNIYLFSDEMYRFLEYDPSKRLPSACELYENAVILFGMSKSFALAGLRIGWLITKNRELNSKFATFKDYTTICGSAPSEILALIGLRAKDKIIRRNLDIIEKNLHLLDKFFERHYSILRWNRPEAGSIAFPKLLANKTSSELCEELIEEESVLLLPEPVYDYNGNNFRIGFGRKNLPEVLERFERYIKNKIN
jgi:aspartate/methionine/tyrosine aminotransferase